MKRCAFLSAAFVLLFSTVPNVECENLKQLLMQKYRGRIELGNFVRTRVNAHGVVEEIVIPPPNTPERRILLNPQNISALDNFEIEPEVVYNNQNLKHFVVTRAVRDYNNDSLSREIIHHCLEYCNQQEYLIMLVIAAAEYNVPNLIDKIMLMADISLLDNSTDFFEQDKSFTSAIIRFGNYHIAKNLILEGFLLDQAPVWIDRICNSSGWNNIEATMDFLEFLVIRMQRWDINSKYIGKTFLHKIILKDTFNEADFLYKSFLAQFFISNLGADPRIQDEFGMTALQYASSQGINLELQELE